MSTFVVLDDPPLGLDFGIDAFSWTTGPDFKGLSLIPKGLHFVYHSTGLGARQGFFLRVGDKKEVIARQWDASNEEISAKSCLNESQLAALGEAIKRGDFNNNLGPYPFDQHRTWKNLTNLVTDDVLSSAGCDLGAIILPGDAGDVTPIMKQDGGKAVSPYFPDSARVATWSDIKGVEASVRESVLSDASMDDTRKGEYLSLVHMDQTLIAQKLVESAHNGRLLPLLGELQLSFVLFLVLYSHPALQHWMACVNLICNSERLLKRNLQFTHYFLRLLYEQLNFVPLDFFSDELSKDNFLGPAMVALFSALSPASTSEAAAGEEERDFLTDEVVQEHRRRLLTFLNKKFGLFEDGVVSHKAMSVYQRKTRNNEDLDALETKELLRGADRDGGEFKGGVADELPVVVSIDTGEEGVATNGSRGYERGLPASVSAYTGPRTSQTLAEQDLQNSKVMMGSWGRELDRSFSSVAASSPSHSQDNVVEMAGEGGTVASGEVDVYSDAETETGTETKSGLTDKEPTDEMPMTVVEVEMMKYSWRYPALYAEMMTAQEKGVQEDFVMVCARVLEEHHADESRKALLNEALLFLEEEISNQQ